MSTLHPLLLLSSVALALVFSVVSLGLSAKTLQTSSALLSGYGSEEDYYYGSDDQDPTTVATNVIVGSALSLLFSLVVAIYTAVLIGVVSARYSDPSIFKKRTRSNGIGLLVMATLQALMNIVDLGLLGSVGATGSVPIGGGVTGVLGGLFGIAIGVSMIRDNGITRADISPHSEKGLPQHPSHLQSQPQPSTATPSPNMIQLNGQIYVAQQSGEPAVPVQGM